MTTCARCGAGRWHPEIFQCLADDCELRGLTSRASADVLSPDASAVLPLVPFAGHVAAVAGEFFDDRSRDGETYSFGSEMQVGGVHAHRGTL
ncbi:hypothetical protein [Sphingomonas abaci]|uniref:Uncharacterized protein n=1 Tax=Sphingomonas abaci TaxID=237611 RepID=A0A7W7F0S5_9SPHN|nr:hypothetical protein [Sphingomonas abaci]MBB4618650.1 hypothetical protein [Sphingomonas abaci]